MIAPVELLRDETGAVVLTAQQAVALARLSTPEGRHNADGMALLAALWSDGVDTYDILARWIVRWGMVVDAAVECCDARAAAFSDGNWLSATVVRRLEDAEAVLAASVGVARHGITPAGGESSPRTADSADAQEQAQ